MSRAIGSRQMRMRPALGNLSQLALWQGDAAQALVQARAAVDVAVAVQAADFEAGARYRSAKPSWRLGTIGQRPRPTRRPRRRRARSAWACSTTQRPAGRRAALAADDVAGAMGLRRGLAGSPALTAARSAARIRGASCSPATRCWHAPATRAPPSCWPARMPNCRPGRRRSPMRGCEELPEQRAASPRDRGGVGGGIGWRFGPELSGAATAPKRNLK